MTHRIVFCFLSNLITKPLILSDDLSSTKINKDPILEKFHFDEYPVGHKQKVTVALTPSSFLIQVHMQICSEL